MEEASVAGESPDRSKQRESSEEPTSGSAGPVPEARTGASETRDPRLAVAREDTKRSAGSAGSGSGGGVDTATRVLSVRGTGQEAETSGEDDDAGASAADSSGASEGDDAVPAAGNDGRLRDAVAAWVATADERAAANARLEDEQDPAEPARDGGEDATAGAVTSGDGASRTDSDTGSGSDTASDTDTGSDAGSDSDSDSVSGSASTSGTDPASDAGSGADAPADSDTPSAPGGNTDPASDPASSSERDAVPEPDPVSASGSGSGADAPSEAGPTTDADKDAALDPASVSGSASDSHPATEPASASDRDAASGPVSSHGPDADAPSGSNTPSTPGRDTDPAPDTDATPAPESGHGPDADAPSGSNTPSAPGRDTDPASDTDTTPGPVSSHGPDADAPSGSDTPSTPGRNTDPAPDMDATPDPESGHGPDADAPSGSDTPSTPGRDTDPAPDTAPGPVSGHGPDADVPPAPGSARGGDAAPGTATASASDPASDSGSGAGSASGGNEEPATDAGSADVSGSGGGPAPERKAGSTPAPETKPGPKSRPEPEPGSDVEPGSGRDGDDGGSGTDGDDRDGDRGDGAPPVDQPTAVFKAPRLDKPAVDQPTTMLKLGDAASAARKAGEKGDAPARSESDAERTSKFVALRNPDDPANRKPPRPPQAPQAPQAAQATEAPKAPSPGPKPPQAPRTGVTAARPHVGPDRTTQQPLPPKPPLDLLAELTNTPPPPETPLRTTVRRVKIWTPLVALLVIVLGVVQAMRPLPAPTLDLTAQDSFTFDGGKPQIPWPESGQAALDVQGIGSFGSSGDQKPVPIASVAKVMTAYVILRDHPLKSGAEGPKIKIDQAAEEQSDAGDESTVNVYAGDSISQREALKAVLIASANNVARLLARWDAGSEKAFVEKMNAAAKDLGMTNTTYTDPSGLNNTTVSTAVDQVKLAKAAMKSPAFREVAAMMSYNDYKGVNHGNWNHLVGHNGVVGIKTGTTTSALGNLVFAAKKEVGGETRTIVGAVVRQPDVGGGILDAALDASDELIRAAQDTLQSSTILKKGSVVGYVDDGLGGRTPVVATKDVKAVGWGGLTVKLTFDADEVPHAAKAGTKVGTLTVGDGGTSGAVKVPVALRDDLVEPGLSDKLTRLG
ncbi:D-alanyl-D-alanine carboxypeptidase [Streptomyces coelicoflavus]|uniref:D-alanyl-D-alanine carboxypeptidase n=1 Tax=Streptomyces coelicoflavus TaxID=285562 RepID=UPI003F4E5705